MKIIEYLKKYGDIVIADPDHGYFYSSVGKSMIGGMRSKKDIKKYGFF